MFVLCRLSHVIGEGDRSEIGWVTVVGPLLNRGDVGIYSRRRAAGVSEFNV